MRKSKVSHFLLSTRTPSRVESHKIWSGTARGCHRNGVPGRRISLTGVAPELPCIIWAVCDPTTLRVIGLREVGRKFHHYQYSCPRGIRFTLIIVHVCFVIKCFYRLLNSITSIQISTLLQSTVNTARGETQEEKG